MCLVSVHHASAAVGSKWCACVRGEDILLNSMYIDTYRCVDLSKHAHANFFPQVIMGLNIHAIHSTQCTHVTICTVFRIYRVGCAQHCAYCSVAAMNLLQDGCKISSNLSLGSMSLIGSV